MNQIAVKPLPVGLPGGIILLQLIVINHPALHQIHQQHLSRTQTLLHQDPGRINGQDSHLR